MIADDEYPCVDCCPLRRPPLPPVGGKAKGGAGCGDVAVERESRDEVEWPALSNQVWPWGGTAIGSLAAHLPLAVILQGFTPAIGCHSSGLYTVILLTSLPFSARLTAPPLADQVYDCTIETPCLFDVINDMNGPGPPGALKRA